MCIRVPRVRSRASKAKCNCSLVNNDDEDNCHFLSSNTVNWRTLFEKYSKSLPKEPFENEVLQRLIAQHVNVYKMRDARR